jgi:hypothetical protein
VDGDSKRLGVSGSSSSAGNRDDFGDEIVRPRIPVRFLEACDVSDGVRWWGGRGLLLLLSRGGSGRDSFGLGGWSGGAMPSSSAGSCGGGGGGGDVAPVEASYMTFVFFGSCSITAAYRRSISLCCRSLSLSMTDWSKVTTDFVGDDVSVIGDFPPPIRGQEKFLLPVFVEGDMLERGEVVYWLTMAGFIISTSRVLLEDCALALRRLPTNRRHIPQKNTVRKYAPTMPPIWAGRSPRSREALKESGGPSSGDGAGPQSMPRG